MKETKGLTTDEKKYLYRNKKVDENQKSEISLNIIHRDLNETEDSNSKV